MYNYLNYTFKLEYNLLKIKIKNNNFYIIYFFNKSNYLFLRTLFVVILN